MNRFKHYWNLGLALVAIAILATTAAIAQEVTGTIVGNVKDTSGALVPSAKVTITNTDKNAVMRTVTTDQSGNYSAPLLPIGHYSVAVEASGFKNSVHSNIVLNLGDKLTENFDLQVGSNAETVNVEANAAQVELQSAAASGLITGTQVRELALNGRNWEQLVTLNPGVSDAGNADQLYVGAFAPQGTNLITFSMNGGRREENNFMIDGFDNEDRGSNLTLLTFPSVDAIAEFRVIRGQYDPEYGRAASGQVNAITKTGTSKLHGNVYEFFRNDALNANDYFNKKSELTNGKPNKPTKLRYNDFGGTIGGPVYIPKIYEQTNKTFFFFSEEARRNTKYSLAHAEIPTADMLQGNFAHPVCTSFNRDPVSGKLSCAGTGNSINPASFDPVAKAYIQDIFSKYPSAPNGATPTDPFGYDSTLRGIFNFREEIYKIDHIFNEKFSISGKILRDKIPTREPGGLFTGMALDNIGSTDTNSPGRNYVLRTTIAPTPSFLIDAGFGYSYGAILSTPSGLLNASASPDVATAVSASLPFKTVLGRVPSISLNGGSGPLTFGPYNDFNKNYTYFGNVSKIWGNHTFKFGAIYYHYEKHENAGNGNQGQYTFNNNFTGFPTGTFNFEQAWANFLLGNVATFTQTSLDLTADILDNQFEYYAQDSWRVRPSLTISYGFRHSFFRQPTDGLGLLENFDPKYYDPAKAPCILANGSADISKTAAGAITSACNPNFDPLNGYIFSNPPAGGTKSPYGSKVARENNMAIAPRIGIAWDPTGSGKTSIRAGYGFFYDSGIIFGNAENDVFNGIGFQNPLTFTNVTFANPTGGAPVPSTGIPGAVTALQSRIDPNYTPPYSQQWSLDIQHEFKGWILATGYYGNNAIHLPGFIDLNQPAMNSYLNCTSANPCYAGPGSMPNATHQNLSDYAISFSNAAVLKNGNVVTPPGVYVSGGNTSLLNALRPYLGYTGMQGVRNIYTSNYHSLQSQLQKQFKNSTMVNISYTWSHGLTTDQADRSTGSILPLQGDMRNNYGPTVGDRTHVLTANFVWELPWLREQKSFLGHTLGGWQVSGIQTFQTGLPSQVSSNQVYDPTGADCLGPSPCSFRANQVGDPNSGAPHNYNTGWFNKSAFTDPGLTFENCPALPVAPANLPASCVAVAQNYIPTERPGAVRLPGFWRTDLGLFKNFKFTERFGGQFRLETFNTFNHTNPVCCSSMTTSSASYGLVRSTRDPRYLELGMKLNF